MRQVEPQHVWVDVTGQWGEHAHPGILIAWRQVNVAGHLQWQGWVIHATAGAAAHEVNPYVYQAWVDARLIRPVEADRPQQDLSRYRPVNS